MVRMSPTTVIPDLLRSLGADPAQLLAELGYDLRLFDDPEFRLSLVARNQIVSHCAERTGCPHFGLLIGQQQGLRTLGLVGLLVKCSPDVETALRSLARYLRLHVGGSTLTLMVAGRSAMLTWHVSEPRAGAAYHVGDATNAALNNVMRELCGLDWRPSEVRFAHRQPTDVGPYRRFFRVPLRFDAEEFALLFSSGHLRQRLPPVDDEVRRLLQRQIDLLEARHPTDFPEQVRSVLRSAITAGQASAEQVAALFGLQNRTFSRRLGEFGVSFRQLLDEARFEFARQLLEDSRKEVAELGELLGYAAPSAFTRAFHRWSGCSPTEWRQAHQRKS